VSESKSTFIGPAADFGPAKGLLVVRAEWVPFANASRTIARSRIFDTAKPDVALF
jgi:hypothetical protein